MKKTTSGVNSFFYFLFLIVVLFTMFAFTATAQESPLKPRLFVIPFSNQDLFNKQNDILCTTVTDTVELTIKLLGDYALITAPEFMAERGSSLNMDPDDFAFLETLEEFTSAYAVDNVIFGKSYADEDGNLVFQGSVYDAGKREVVLTHEEEALSIMDTFEAADNLVIALIGGFSGTHIGFGSVTFENTGLQTGYDIYIDGTFTGRNIEKADKILNGLRHIEVRQKRMLGEEILISQTIDVEEFGRYYISFSIPELTEAERSVIDEIYSTIDRGFYNKDQQQVIEAQFARLEELFANISFNQALQKLFRLEKMEKYRAWNLQKEFWNIEAGARKPGIHLIEETLTLYSDTEQYGNAGKIHRLAYRNTAAVANLLMLKAAYEFSFNRWSDGTDSFNQVRELADHMSSEDLFGFRNEIQMCTAVLNRYRTMTTMAKPTLPFWLLTGGGIGLSGTAAGLWVSDPGSTLSNQVNSLYETYQNETDPAVLENLHREIETAYFGANAVEYAKWGFTVIGPGLITLGSILLAQNANADEKYIKAAMRNVLGDRMTAARMLFGNTEISNGENRMLICSPSGRVHASTGMLYNTTGSVTPCFATLGKGETVHLEASDTWYGDYEMKGHRLHAGLNILVLEPSEKQSPEYLRPPGAITNLAVLVEKGRQYSFTWEIRAGAVRYAVEIAETNDDSVYLLDETEATEYKWRWPSNLEVPLRFRVTGINENGNSTPWSEWMDIPFADESGERSPASDTAERAAIPLKRVHAWANAGGFAGIGPEIGISWRWLRLFPWLESNAYFRLDGMGLSLMAVFSGVFDGEMNINSFSAGVNSLVLAAPPKIVPNRIVFGLDLSYALRSVYFRGDAPEDLEFLMIMGMGGYRWRFKSGFYFQAGARVGTAIQLTGENIEPFFNMQTDAIFGYELF